MVYSFSGRKYPSTEPESLLWLLTSFHSFHYYFIGRNICPIIIIRFVSSTIFVSPFLPVVKSLNGNLSPIIFMNLSHSIICLLFYGMSGSDILLMYIRFQQKSHSLVLLQMKMLNLHFQPSKSDTGGKGAWKSQMKWSS